MKSPVLLVVSLAVLLAGCTTQKQTQATAQATPYRKPLTSPGAKFGSLPPVVQRTVLAEAGQQEVVDAVRDTSSGRVVYKIYFREPELFPPLYVAPDGSVLNHDLTVAVQARQGTRLKLADVPAPVKKAITDRSLAGEVSYINAENWNGRKVYVVIFKDETHNPKLIFGEDGSAVDESE